MSASMARISHRATATLTSRTTPAARQGPGKVAIRPVYPMTPHRGPAPRDCVGPGREPDSSDRHGRTYGADRDFAGALGLTPDPPETHRHRLRAAYACGSPYGRPASGPPRPRLMHFLDRCFGLEATGRRELGSLPMWLFAVERSRVVAQGGSWPC